MAGAVVGVLIAKLGEALAKKAAAYGAYIISQEASDLSGLVGEMSKAKEELESMEAYLRDSEKLKDIDETTGIFVDKVRGLAFRIEDVVDEFTYKLEDDKYIDMIKKRIRHVHVWHRLALELRDINVELEEAVKRRDRYATPRILERYAEGSDHQARSTNQTLYFARKEDLVGIEDKVEKMTRWLQGDFYGRSSKVVTVWGMGGVGKTTLVDQVYKIVKSNYHTSAWVTVSKNFQVVDLLRKIVRELGISVDASHMELRSLVEATRSHLEGKSYIMVLDDVWEKGVWLDIMDVFPTNGVSRFIITSRKYEVASLSSDNCIMKLTPLEKHLSMKLFCNVAFRNTDNKRCPLELQNFAEKFLQICDGLPIAIACIGRMLACKPPTYSAWENVYEELELHSTGQGIPGVDIVLTLSIEDLPHELKNCFLYCALTPEDYKIKRRKSIRHWITAGFIREKGNKTLEEVAEIYLNEMVNRSLLQVVERNEFGRVKCCRMHDVVRHIALNKAEKECFGKVYEGSSRFLMDGARRLSIQSASIAPLCQSGPTHLRTIRAFTDHVDIELLKPILSSSRLLSTLDLQGTKIKILPNEVFNLFNLRFLGLNNTEIGILPEAVGRLQNLEVLDVFSTAILSLPKGIANLKKLRYLYASASTKDGFPTAGVMVPRGIQNLTRLHALQKIKASSETICDVTALTELRTFSVSEVTTEHSSNLCTAIRNMNHLVSLRIAASSKNDLLPCGELHLAETLSKLVLEGVLEKKRMPQILSSWAHLEKLTYLGLSMSKLDEDSFSSLFVLPGLRHLCLVYAYHGNKLCFSPMSFPRLRKLVIRGALWLSQVQIAQGALSNLVELELSDCPKLKRLPHDIEFLRALEDLRLDDTADKLIDRLCQTSRVEELTKIRHVRNITVNSGYKKFFARN